MVYVGVDVSKNKHDCCMIDEYGEVVSSAFTIWNNKAGFEYLMDKIREVETDMEKVKVGLEATGHYSLNILEFLMKNEMITYVLNPLHTNMYRKSLSLRLTKTDKVDCRTIAMMLRSDVNIRLYTKQSWLNEEMKSLTRYRFDRVQERAQLKQSIARLVNILFPELDKLVPTIQVPSIYALLGELPSAEKIAEAPIEKIREILYEASHGRYNLEKAEEIKEAAKNSIGTRIPAKSMELRHTINLIQEMNQEVCEIERDIKHLFDRMNTTILSIPGIGYNLGAMIIAEIGDFERFDSADKLLAYSGVSPSTYQSGMTESSYSHMEKRGSKYLRYALIEATKCVCIWDPAFAAYLAKKRGEGKHYNVAISHAAKKLVRTIYAMEKSGEKYQRNTATGENAREKVL